MTALPAYEPIDEYVPLDPESVKGYLSRFWQGKHTASCDSCRDERQRTGSVIARCVWHRPKTPGQQAQTDELWADYDAKRAANPDYAFGDGGEWDAPHPRSHGGRYL